MNVFFGNYHSDEHVYMNTDDLLRSDKQWRLVLVLKGEQTESPRARSQ